MARTAIRTEIKGYNELTNRITQMGRKGAAIRDEALRSAAEPVLYEMLRRASGADGGPNVRTGRGRGSIAVGKVSALRGAKMISIGVHKAQRDTGLHMYYQEFGTAGPRSNPPRPFIRPAFETKKKEAFEILKNELKKGLGL